MIDVVATGLQATVQDLGRPGFAHLGVPYAGAVDPVSLRLANRLVGNDEGAAAIEFLLGGLAVRFTTPAAFAIAGAPVPANLDGRPIPDHALCHAEPGQLLVTGRPLFGLRSYLAVSGGFAVEPLLGSRSTDTLSGLGPPPLRPGTVIATGEVGSIPDSFPAEVPRPVSPDRFVTLSFTWGPREDWLEPAARTEFTTARWEVTTDSDRIGVRLSGPRLATIVDRQLPTEGLPLGAVQVPPSGAPIVHLANHPPTGGYPVIAVVCSADVPRLAQARPGTAVAFRALASAGHRPWRG